MLGVTLVLAGCQAGVRSVTRIPTGPEDEWRIGAAGDIGPWRDFAVDAAPPGDATVGHARAFADWGQREVSMRLEGAWERAGSAGRWRNDSVYLTYSIQLLLADHEMFRLAGWAGLGLHVTVSDRDATEYQGGYWRGTGGPGLYGDLGFVGALGPEDNVSFVPAVEMHWAPITGVTGLFSAGVAIPAGPVIIQPEGSIHCGAFLDAVEHGFCTWSVGAGTQISF